MTICKNYNIFQHSTDRSKQSVYGCSLNISTSPPSTRYSLTGQVSRQTDSVLVDDLLSNSNDPQPPTGLLAIIFIIISIHQLGSIEGTNDRYTSHPSPIIPSISHGGTIESASHLAENR